MLGYPDRSLNELQGAVRSAETLGHPFTLAQTLCFVALVHIFRHEPSAAADYAGRALRICEEQRIAHYHAMALCENGWALGASGESEEGLAQIGTRDRQLRPWGVPAPAGAGVAGRCPIGDRPARSGARIGRRWA